METQLKDVASRIRELRTIAGLTEAEMAAKTEITEPILVQTTSCEANCSSFPIAAATIALETATGAPVKAINAAYSPFPQENQPVYRLNSTAPPTATVGARMIRQNVPIANSRNIPFVAENSH